MDDWDPFASSDAEVKTPSITISDLSWPPMLDSATSAPNAPPASSEASGGMLDWPDLSAPPASGQGTGQGLTENTLLCGECFLNNNNEHKTSLSYILDIRSHPCP